MDYAFGSNNLSCTPTTNCRVFCLCLHMLPMEYLYPVIVLYLSNAPQRGASLDRNPLSLDPRRRATGGRESVCGHPGGCVELGPAGLSSGRRRHARGLAAPCALAGSAARRCMTPATLTDPVYPLSMHVVLYYCLLIICCVLTGSTKPQATAAQGLHADKSEYPASVVALQSGRCVS